MNVLGWFRERRAVSTGLLAFATGVFAALLVWSPGGTIGIVLWAVEVGILAFCVAIPATSRLRG